MALLPRFLIADNPMADPDGEYVVHTQHPRFIAKRVYGNSITDFEIVDDIDGIGEFFKNDPSKAAKLMRRMGDWYVAYLKWEEENAEEEEEEE